MSRVNEFTPLLVNDKIQSRPQHHRSVWQFVLAGALSLGILSLFRQQISVPLEIADVTVSFNEDKAITDDASDVAFLSSTETFKDPSVDPCVDFYDYACGGWLKSHEIPSDRPNIDSSFYVVSETNKDTIQQILDQNPPQIGQFYHSCLSDEEVDANALAFVTQLVNNVHQVNSILALMELAGGMDQSLGISTFFSVFVGADSQDPTTNVLKLSQGGLTLPSREYYLEQSKVDAYAALYVDYVTKLFAVGELDHQNVSEFAEAVLEIETTFANISLPKTALRDLETTNMAYSFAEIAQRYPFLMAYLNGIYKKEPFPMLHAIIATPNFFEAQNQFLSDDALLPQLKKYLSFHVIDSFGTLLGEYFRRVSHDFHGKILGTGNLLPRNQYCMQVTTAFLGDEVGKYYMQDVFGPDAKKAAESLVEEIEESLKALLLTEAWLDKITYDAAVEKLSKVKNYIGGPDDVPPLPFELQADAFFDNVKRLLQLGSSKAIQSVGKPVDEKAWEMFASTVNAYYDPSANKMVFPAAILQPPFYSAEHFPAAANFARIGMLMGHELSHGFDDQGRKYDGNGALRSWWTPSVSAEFTEKAQCLAAQYSAFPVVSIEDGRVLGNVNGNLTLGENIADNGGIRLAYEAYHLWKRSFAPPPIVPSSEIQPEATNPDPATASPSDDQAPEQTPPVPSKEIPAAPVVPVPIETGPDKPIPVETLPPPVLPVPKAEAPEVPQAGPDGGTPGGSPPQPTVVPEPQPANIPQEINPVPEVPTPVKKTPAPPGKESATEAPTVTPDSSTPPPDSSNTPPTLPDAPDTPAPPNGSTPPLPDTPDTPSPPNGSTPPLPDTPDTPAPPNGSTPPLPDTPDTPAPPNGSTPPLPDTPDTPAPPNDSAPPTLPDAPDSPAPPNGSTPPLPDAPDTPASHNGSTPPLPDAPDRPSSPNGSTPPTLPDVTNPPIPPNDSTPPTLPGAPITPNSPDGSTPPTLPDAPDTPSPSNTPTPFKVPSVVPQPGPSVVSPDKTSKHKHKKEEDEPSAEPEKKDHTEIQKHHESGSEKISKHNDSEREDDHDKDVHNDHERNEGHHRDEEKGDGLGDYRHKGSHHSHKMKDNYKNESKKDHHAKHSNEDGEESDKHMHHKHESKKERGEARKKEKKENRRHEKEKHHHHHDKVYEENHKARHAEKKHHRHEEWSEECGDCGRKEYHGHHYKHEEDKDIISHGCGKGEADCGSKRHKWTLSESKYPFSGGDARIQSMVKKLARAFAQPDDSVADDRLFFTAFAQNWCEKRTPGYAELLRTIDTHSPGKWRVNGPLMNYAKFAEVFSCPVGTPMNPAKKCVIW
ncbi:hypothetical protein KXD40_008505 [Peronospora effusa]|nr:hypothetical protein KXD40_008505 [Peronospora effusa]